MAKIVRYNGNLVPFASSSLGTERTLFGEVTQADDITSQYTADFLRGWGIVGPSDQPTLQDFNAVSYTHGQILSYLHQTGVAEYNASQEYHVGSLANVSGTLYTSLTNTNVGNAPASSPTFWAILNASLNIVGESRNLRASVTVASASATFAADQVTVSESLTGKSYRLGSFSKVINLGTTGAGGMDTGLAPVSGVVAIYAIYNPTTGVSALLAANATAALQPEIYGGANMPSGYTASALVSIWRTNASRLMNIGSQNDRRVHTEFVGLLDINSDSVPLVSMVAANYLSFNTKTFSGQLVVGNNGAVNTSIALNLAASSTGIGGRWLNDFVLAAGTGQVPFFDAPIITPQTFYTARVTGSAPARYQVIGSGYTF